MRCGDDFSSKPRKRCPLKLYQSSKAFIHESRGKMLYPGKNIGFILSFELKQLITCQSFGNLIQVKDNEFKNKQK